MINGVATWIFNVMLWGALVTLAVLLYEVMNKGFLVDNINPMNAGIGLAVVALVSLFWPRY